MLQSELATKNNLLRTTISSGNILYRYSVLTHGTLEMNASQYFRYLDCLNSTHRDYEHTHTHITEVFRRYLKHSVVHRLGLCRCPALRLTKMRGETEAGVVIQLKCILSCIQGKDNGICQSKSHKTQVFGYGDLNQTAQIKGEYC